MADGSSPVTYTQRMKVVLRLGFFFLSGRGNYIERILEKNSRACFVYSAQSRCCPCGFFSCQVAKTNTTNFIQLGAGSRFLPVSDIRRSTHPEAKGPAEI